MVFLNIYTYFHSVSRHSGDLEQYLLNEYGFNFENFLSHKWYVLVTSNFLHFNYTHLLGNMCLLLVFGGILEFVGGTALTAMAYLFALNANIPTMLFIHPIFRALDFWVGMSTCTIWTSARRSV
jgi:membrane associated rhomboid family serine protease